MSLPFMSSSEAKYERLEPLSPKESQDGSESLAGSSSNPSYRPSRRHNSYTITIAIITTALLSLAIGFLGGRHLPDLIPSDFLLSPAGMIPLTWHYNKTFTRAPTPETEAAWLSIFPRGRGFIHHPTLEANVSGIAVFHELHCLSGIRLAYYSALNQSLSQPTSPSTNPDAHVDSLNSHSDPHHIRHCFDYLRQALMCAADTNLETIDWKLGGSTGWGFERKCRDYEKVVQWAEKWRLHEQKAIA